MESAYPRSQPRRASAFHSDAAVLSTSGSHASAPLAASTAPASYVSGTAIPSSSSVLPSALDPAQDRPAHTQSTRNALTSHTSSRLEADGAFMDEIDGLPPTPEREPAQVQNSSACHRRQLRISSSDQPTALASPLQAAAPLSPAVIHSQGAPAVLTQPSARPDGGGEEESRHMPQSVGSAPQSCALDARLHADASLRSQQSGNLEAADATPPPPESTPVGPDAESLVRSHAAHSLPSEDITAPTRSTPTSPSSSPSSPPRTSALGNPPRAPTLPAASADARPSPQQPVIKTYATAPQTHALVPPVASSRRSFRKFQRIETFLSHPPVSSGSAPTQRHATRSLLPPMEAAPGPAPLSHGTPPPPMEMTPDIAPHPAALTASDLIPRSRQSFHTTSLQRSALSASQARTAPTSVLGSTIAATQAMLLASQQAAIDNLMAASHMAAVAAAVGMPPMLSHQFAVPTLPGSTPLVFNPYLGALTYSIPVPMMAAHGMPVSHAVALSSSPLSSSLLGSPLPLQFACGLAPGAAASLKVDKPGRSAAQHNVPAAAAAVPAALASGEASGSLSAQPVASARSLSIQQQQQQEQQNATSSLETLSHDLPPDPVPLSSAQVHDAAPPPLQAIDASVTVPPVAAPSQAPSQGSPHAPPHEPSSSHRRASSSQSQPQSSPNPPNLPPSPSTPPAQPQPASNKATSSYGDSYSTWTLARMPPLHSPHSLRPPLPPAPRSSVEPEHSSGISNASSLSVSKRPPPEEIMEPSRHRVRPMVDQGSQATATPAASSAFKFHLFAPGSAGPVPVPWALSPPSRNRSARSQHRPVSDLPPPRTRAATAARPESRDPMQ